MTKMVVRWWPPYSNQYKDQPCKFEREAEMMRDWFISIGVHADIVQMAEVEYIKTDGTSQYALMGHRT